MRLRLLPANSPLGWTPYAWLFYLSFFIVYSAALDRSALTRTIDAAALLLFLGLYFRGFWLRGLALLQVIVPIFALGAVLSPRNPGAGGFFIYAAAFVGEVGPPALSGRLLLLLVGMVGIEAWLVPLQPMAWLPGVFVSLLVGGTNIHFSEVRRKDRILSQAREAAEHLAVVAERERIARDLHDLLGHTLSVIVIKSELAAKLAERDSPRAIAEIRDVERISRNALQEVRQAIHGYRGERLQDELSNGRAALDAAGVTLDADVEPAGLSGETEHALALALREAITNVIRHARARRCAVALTREPDGVRLVVADDGVGGEHVEGAGLSGMRARLAGVGGTLLREGGHGTRLTLVVPDRSAARVEPVACR
jgi:two-component system, NarL family, sensor histidine kinase DesK